MLNAVDQKGVARTSYCIPHRFSTERILLKKCRFCGKMIKEFKGLRCICILFHFFLLFYQMLSSFLILQTVEIIFMSSVESMLLPIVGFLQWSKLCPRSKLSKSSKYLLSFLSNLLYFLFFSFLFFSFLFFSFLFFSFLFFSFLFFSFLNASDHLISPRCFLL